MRKKLVVVVLLGLILVGCQEKKHILPGEDDIGVGEMVEK